MSGSNQVGLRWSKQRGEYVCGSYRIRRFQSGLRDSSVTWILTSGRFRLGLNEGVYPRLRDAKAYAWDHARGIVS